MTFRWCCGFSPWWWWNLRHWKLETVLARPILAALRRGLKTRDLPVPSPKPDLAVFERFLGEDRPMLVRPGDLPPRRTLGRPGELLPQPLTINRPGDLPQLKAKIDPTALSDLRERLVQRLPAVPALERLHLWPWFPWQPWFDCTPDIIFKVTQDCREPGTVIYDESPWDIRLDIPTDLSVTLTANSQACCLPDIPTPEGACVVISNVCGHPVEQIGGNLGAPAGPVGYLHPGGDDQPFADTVTISGVFGTLAAVDYYELEWLDTDALWKAMPAGAVSGFSRRFFGPWLAGATDPLSPFHNVPFPVTTIGGRRVIESREHFEATHDPGTWGPGNSRLWVEDSFFLLANWWTRDHFANGTHRLRLVGWDQVGPDTLANQRVLPLCATEVDNELVLTTDNQFLSDPDGHPHACGTGTVHACTAEPDTDIVSVKILHTDGTETDVNPCGNIPISATDLLQVDFLVSDAGGHLGSYSLAATYAENLVRYLICTDCPGGDLLGTVAGATLSAGPGAQAGPNYRHANPARSAVAQGAAAPTWSGGTFRFTVRAREAFPETCCYQLELRAYKRTLVGCSGVHWNLSEYSFMVVV